MFAGHVGIALAAGRAAPAVNVGLLIGAALWLDVVLWIFVLAGWEAVRIPADFASTHQPEFLFPWSHGLVAGVLWSVLAGGAAFFVLRAHRESRARTALVVAAVVFSHWLADALVHRPEMPLAGTGSRNVGLALWDHMPVALAVEAALVFAGIVMFLKASGLSRARQLGLATLSVVILLSTIAGMTVAPPPPSAAAMAGSSLVTIVVVCLLAGWLGKGAPRRNET